MSRPAGFDRGLHARGRLEPARDDLRVVVGELVPARAERRASRDVEAPSVRRVASGAPPADQPGLQSTDFFSSSSNEEIDEHM